MVIETYAFISPGLFFRLPPIATVFSLRESVPGIGTVGRPKDLQEGAHHRPGPDPGSGDDLSSGRGWSFFLMFREMFGRWR